MSKVSLMLYEMARTMESVEQVVGLGIQAWEAELPNRLRDLRQTADLSLAELAEQTGVSRSHLHSIEHGESDPTVGTLLKILKVYGLDLRIIQTEAEDE